MQVSISPIATQVPLSEAHAIARPAGPVLSAAYAHCRDLTAQHSKSFYMASRLMPAPKRGAIQALYAFCRTVDDLVDWPAQDTQSRLDYWRQVTLSGSAPADDPVATAWCDTVERWGIPHHYALELIDGVQRDLYQTCYDTFEDLSGYCYGVASTVGLMAMHITGFRGPEAIPYAVKLGIALQMTNILRDVGEDWSRGRVYLPAEDLARFGLDEGDIARGVVTPAWRDLLRFEIARTRQLYAEAWPGIRLLDPSGQFAIAAAATLYRGILDEIERADYDVFTRRAHLSKWQKLRQLPGIWWQTRTAAGAERLQ